MVLSPTEKILLGVSFFSLMIAIGASIDKQDLKAVWHDKKPVYWGLAMQHLLLPALAIMLASAYGLAPLIAETLVLIAACPGGSTSNLFTYLSKGNVSVSLFLSVITTLDSVLMTPLILLLAGTRFAGSQAAAIPLKNLVATLLISLIPVLLGFVVRLKARDCAQKLEKFCSRLGYVCILTMVVLWYSQMKSIVMKQDMKVFFVTGFLSFLGILLAFVISRGVKLPTSIARTLSFEAGIQNAPLAFTIISLNLPPAVAQEIGWVPLLYGAISVANAALFTLFYRLSDKIKGSKPEMVAR